MLIEFLYQSIYIRKEENILNIPEVSNITHGFLTYVFLKFHTVSRTYLIVCMTYGKGKKEIKGF